MISVETFTNADQAAGALGPDAIYHGGGTIVMRTLNYGEQNFSRIVRSTDSALKRIAIAGDRIEIGAGVTMSEVIASRDLDFLHPVARSVGGPTVRNAATVGGNLFAEHPYGDFATALLALDAKVRTSGGSEQDMESFLAGRNSFNGLVTSLSIVRPQGQDFRYRKVTRIKPKGVSIMSIAAWTPQSAGRVGEARIAFGAMGATPLRAKEAERALSDKSLDRSSVEAAMAALRGDFQPPDDALASGWYRSEVAPVHLRRLLLDEEVAR
ncbi:MAG: FAD binding domain-containing protein [Pseudomonadota bacterium]